MEYKTNKYGIKDATGRTLCVGDHVAINEYPNASNGYGGYYRSITPRNVSGLVVSFGDFNAVYVKLDEKTTPFYVGSRMEKMDCGDVHYVQIFDRDEKNVALS